ncbi:hypothetical protein QC764_0071160 [Podospora pseudoanserina]|uniref:Ecp2 effector protein domain-containing protein n=1 Tax=Podospora pseudoanserina TaxID=2609844 RepID=A0ABR0IAU9_9PEZI|nr:hypothetical protein QC764_0071160 [Podospora pseudoanserina]
MNLLLLLLILATVALSTASTFPPTPTSTPNTTPIPRPLRYEIGCKDTILDIPSMIVAARSLIGYCRGIVTPWTKMSWVYNNTRAYICDSDQRRPQGCLWDQVYDAWVDIGVNCGFGRAGFTYEQQYEKTWGFDDVNAKWCGTIDPY